MTDWFSADPHYWHRRIIDHCGRPFKDVIEMNEALIENWNNLVKPSDNAYILGDVSLGSPGKTEEILKRLNGKKHLILGNHDGIFRKKERLKNYFEWVKELAIIKIHDREENKHQVIYLCHYAMLTWGNKHYGTWQLYGHSHGSLPDNPDSFQLDVGVDCHSFKPISYEQIKALMSKKKNKAIEHHEPRSKE